jgi:hypothetical protein
MILSSPETSHNFFFKDSQGELWKSHLRMYSYESHPPLTPPIKGGGKFPLLLVAVS